jgi:hypothetical protein
MIVPGQRHSVEDLFDLVYGLTGSYISAWNALALLNQAYPPISFESWWQGWDKRQADMKRAEIKLPEGTLILATAYDPKADLLHWHFEDYRIAG